MSASTVSPFVRHFGEAAEHDDLLLLAARMHGHDAGPQQW